MGRVDQLRAAETTIARAWEAVLGVDVVEPSDDFFALGGNSLAAAEVILEVNRLCSVDLPIRALFEGPTVSQLAAAVRASAGAPGEPQIGRASRSSDGGG
jgi:acyl carrier protein